MSWISHVEESSRRRVLLSWMVGMMVVAGTAFTLRAEDVTPSISWVSADRVVLEPEKEQTVTLRYRVSAPASVTIRFLGPGGEPVRSIHQVLEEPGDQSVVWEGRDDNGKRVTPEAYRYTISALPIGAEEGAAPAVVYDMGRGTGGESVRVETVEWDVESGRLVYVVSKPARVRAMLGRPATGWLLETWIDWEPRAGGRHEEDWSGLDPDGVVQAREMEDLVPVLQAFALPENAVIVKGSDVALPEKLSNLEKVPHRWERNESSERILLQHALHPRSRCYDPDVVVSFPGTDSAGGVVQLTEPTPLRLDIAAEQPAGRVEPIHRVSVFVFINGEIVERNLDGYVPYQWNLDPSSLEPGEHLVTGLLAWREDHFGVKHVRVYVDETSASGQ